MVWCLHGLTRLDWLHGHLLGGDEGQWCFYEGFEKAFLMGPFSGLFDVGWVFGCSGW